MHKPGKKRAVRTLLASFEQKKKGQFELFDPSRKKRGRDSILVVTSRRKERSREKVLNLGPMERGSPRQEEISHIPAHREVKKNGRGMKRRD